jgi:hypothetical protein
MVVDMPAIVPLQYQESGGRGRNFPEPSTPTAWHLSHPEVAGVGVLEDQGRDRGLGVHHVALGELDADLFGGHQHYGTAAAARSAFKFRPERLRVPGPQSVAQGFGIRKNESGRSTSSSIRSMEIDCLMGASRTALSMK